jgi:hypothetical protein
MGKPKTTYPMAMAVFDSWETPKWHYNYCGN